MLREPDRAWRVTELSEISGVSLGHVSNVRNGLIDREWAARCGRRARCGSTRRWRIRDLDRRSLMPWIRAARGASALPAGSPGHNARWRGSDRRRGRFLDAARRGDRQEQSSGAEGPSPVVHEQAVASGEHPSWLAPGVREYGATRSRLAAVAKTQRGDDIGQESNVRPGNNGTCNIGVCRGALHRSMEPAGGAQFRHEIPEAIGTQTEE